MVEGAVIQVVKYWDGSNLSTVDSLNGEFFAGTQDIAVDTLGQAWVFTGAGPSGADSLKVYTQNGRQQAYSIHFDQIAYGSFFLNDTLYLGTQQDSIFPVIINGNNASLGSPILFPSQGFTDMASCQKTQSSNSINKKALEAFKIWPNPSHGLLKLSKDIEKSDISIYNTQGQLIVVNIKGRVIDLQE